MNSILLIEDNEDLIELIQFHLEKERYKVSIARNGVEAVRALKIQSFDMIILDLMIPGISGLEILTYLKNEPSLKSIPVIIESAKSEDIDVISGLEMGAEDYVTKPFSPKVLLARVRKILSRNNPKKELVWNDPQLKINIESRELFVEGELVSLTQIEFDILLFLADNAGRVVSRDQILEGAWKDEVFVINRVVDVHLTSLRRKIKSAAKLIHTVRGVGYRMEPPS